MNIIKKLQDQPENIRKIILWSVVIIVGLGLLIWWVINSSQKLKKYGGEEMKQESQI